MILREQSQGRLNEAIQVIDYVYNEIYRWHLHFIKTRYTETHSRRITGERGMSREVRVHADHIPEGLQIEVVAGQSLPEDRVYRSIRAAEAFKAGLITPMRYLEETNWDNPEKLVKESMMFKINPLSLLKFNDEERRSMYEAGQQGGGQPEMEQKRAAQLQEVTAMLQSPEFQGKTDVEKARIIDQVEAQFPELKQG